MSTGEEKRKSYRETVESKIDGVKKEVLGIVKQIFDNMKDAKSSGQAYVSSGSEKDGAAALSSLNNTRDKIKELGSKDDYATLPNDA